MEVKKKAELGAPGGLVSKAGPIYRGYVLAAVDSGLIPPCGPLLHVIPPLSPLSPVHSSAVLSD